LTPFDVFAGVKGILLPRIGAPEYGARCARGRVENGVPKLRSLKQLGRLNLLFATAFPRFDFISLLHRVTTMKHEAAL
jgi:hypothetical protein